MTKGDGKPCVKCGTSRWYDSGTCVQCKKENGRKWNSANLERRREICRKWDRANPEAHSGYRRRNPEVVKKRINDWRRANPNRVNAMTNRRRTRRTEAGGSYTAEEFNALCDLYDNRCLACGKEKPLVFDHVIPVVKGGTSDISNAQPLCRSCNSIKGDKTTDYRTKPGVERWKQEKLL